VSDLLLWRGAAVRDPAPCVACGLPAILRHPVTGKPHHKVCDTAPPDTDSTPGRTRAPRHRQTTTTDRSPA
jgi:hypothetical protein